MLNATRLGYLAGDGFQSLVSLVLGPRQISTGGTLVAQVLSRPFHTASFPSHDWFAIPTVMVDSSTWTATGEPSFPRRLLRGRERGLRGIASER